VFRHRTGDHLTLRNIFREFKNQEKHRKSWCKLHFVNYRGMQNAEKIYDQLVQYSTQQLGPQAEPLHEVGMFLFVVCLVCFFLIKTIP
jgi:HrpA-like RNA helicase